MRFVLTDEELNKYKNDDSQDENNEFKDQINPYKSEQQNKPEKANSRSNSLDKARLETNSGINSKATNQQMRAIQNYYPVIADFQDYDQYANHEKQFYVPQMHNKKMKDQSCNIKLSQEYYQFFLQQIVKNNVSGYNDYDDCDNQSSQRFDILPMLNESSSSQQKSYQISQPGSQQISQQGSLKLSQQGSQSSKGFKLANKMQIGLDYQQQQLSSIKGKSKIFLQSKEINEFQQRNLQSDQNKFQNPKGLGISSSSSQNIFQKNGNVNLQYIKINDNFQIGKERNQDQTTGHKQLFQNKSSFNSNLIPSSLTRNNLNHSQNSNITLNSSQNQQQQSQLFQKQAQNLFRPNGAFQSNSQQGQDNKLKYLPRYQENFLANKQSNFVSRQNAEKQMIQRIQEKKEIALNMRKKKGFLVTEKYKQKLLRDDESESGKKSRNGLIFEKHEKLYQQVLLRYYKKDLEDKAIREDGVDFLMFQVPKCLKPKPNIQVKKVEENKLYYGVLQSMRDKHFMDMLEFLQKGNMFTLDQLKRFEEKRLELLNNNLKYNVLFRPKKKKFGTTSFSNFANRQLVPGQIFPNQSFQNNNSMNGGQNSYDFTSESNYMYGDGWSNTNQSSDQYILNVINSLKNQQQQGNPFNKSKQPQVEQQQLPSQTLSLKKDNHHLKSQKPNYFKMQKQIQQQQFEEMINASQINEQKDFEQNKMKKKKDISTKEQVLLKSQQMESSNSNSQDQIQDQGNLKKSTQIRTFSGIIADGINKISQFLSEKEISPSSCQVD